MVTSLCFCHELSPIQNWLYSTKSYVKRKYFPPSSRSDFYPRSQTNQLQSTSTLFSHQSTYTSHCSLRLHGMLTLDINPVLQNYWDDYWVLSDTHAPTPYTHTLSRWMLTTDEHDHTWTNTACPDCLQCRAASPHVESRLTLAINKLSVSAPRAVTSGD